MHDQEAVLHPRIQLQEIHGPDYHGSLYIACLYVAWPSYIAVFGYSIRNGMSIMNINGSFLS